MAEAEFAHKAVLVQSPCAQPLKNSLTSRCVSVYSLCVPFKNFIYNLLDNIYMVMPQNAASGNHIRI